MKPVQVVWLTIVCGLLLLLLAEPAVQGHSVYSVELKVYVHSNACVGVLTKGKPIVWATFPLAFPFKPLLIMETNAK